MVSWKRFFFVGSISRYRSLSPGQGFIGELVIHQGPPHAFPSEFFTVDVSFTEPIPENHVMMMVNCMEFVKGSNAHGRQFNSMVKVLQGLAGIGFKIPKGMVQVKKNVFVCTYAHCSGFILQTYYSFVFFMQYCCQVITV